MHTTETSLPVLSEDEERWYFRAAKAMAPAVKETYESDWMDAANCLAESVEDTEFIERPTMGQVRKWDLICKQCPVSMQCMEWADKNEVHGVFIAGEWRE